MFSRRGCLDPIGDTAITWGGGASICLCHVSDDADDVDVTIAFLSRGVDPSITKECHDRIELTSTTLELVVSGVDAAVAMPSFR